MVSSQSSDSNLLMKPTPCSIELEYLDHKDVDIRKQSAKYVVHHFYFRCTDLSETPLPLDANPRRPENTTQVQAMRDTLENSPKDFVNRNNGIVTLASEVYLDNHGQESVVNDGGRVSLQFEEGEGVCNGGHTLLAIQNYAEDPDALVHMEVIEMDSSSATETDKRKEISEIADARNNNNQLEERSEANFLGYYDQFKQQLGDSDVVSWLEGDSNAKEDAIDAYQFFRILKSLDVDRYGHPLYTERGKNHSSLATSVTRIHSSWKKEMDEWKTSGGDPSERPLRYLTPIVNDLIFLREMISHNLKYSDYPQGVRRQKLYQDYIKSDMRDLLLQGFPNQDGFDLPKPFEVLMIGLYRTNIYLSEASTDDAELIGWFRDPEDLWKQRSRAIIDELQRDYEDGEKDPKNFIRLNGPFTHDFYIHGMDAYVTEDPEIVYQIEDGTRYRAVDTPDEATHKLIVHDDPERSDSLETYKGKSADGKLMRKEPLEKVFNYI